MLLLMSKAIVFLVSQRCRLCLHGVARNHDDLELRIKSFAVVGDPSKSSSPIIGRAPFEV